MQDALRSRVLKCSSTIHLESNKIRKYSHFSLHICMESFSYLLQLQRVWLDSRIGFVAGSSERQQGNRQIIQLVISRFDIGGQVLVLADDTGKPQICGRTLWQNHVLFLTKRGKENRTANTRYQEVLRGKVRKADVAD